MEGVINVVKYWHKPIYLLYETYNAQILVILFSGILLKIVATRCHILQLKCTKFDFGWGSAPDPAGGAYSVPPDFLAGFRERFAAGGEAGVGKRRERGRWGKGSGGEGKGGPQVTVEPGPLTALLRHWWYTRV